MAIKLLPIGPPPLSAPPLPASTGSGFDWTTLIPIGASVGGSLLGQTLQNKQANAMSKEQLAQQQSQFDTNQAFRNSEAARRNMMQGLGAPANLRALGYRDPAQINQLTQKVSGPMLGSSSAPGMPNGTPMFQPAAPQSSTLAKGIGLGGGLGSIAAGAAFGGPVGAAVGGAAMLGSAIASKVGAGRRAANSFVDSVENPFGAELKAISKMLDAGDTPGAAARLQQAYQGYKAAVNQAIGAGGKEALVAQQSLQNQDLQRTIQTLAQQVGVTL